MAELQNNGAVVEAKNLTKVFRDFWHRPKVRAVDGISFEVRRGEVFGLLGPNGSGKTTTLRMILGLLYPTRGVLRVLGHSPRNVRTKARIGYLPEESYLYPYLTCEETLNFYGRLFDLNGGERKHRTKQLLGMIGLQHARTRMISELSKGMARRIGLAQALINDPDVVVLDEPTAGLDPLGCRQVKDLILTLARRGKTVILSSHLLADVEDVCDRIAILFNGRFQAVGPIRELLEERHRMALMVPEVEPQVLKALLAAMREVLGREPEVERPRRDLEQFFLDVVAEARRAAAAEQGEERLADYLAAPAQPKPDAVLASLLPPSADAAPAEAAPKEEARPQAPAPGPAATPESRAEADHKLRDLLGPDAGGGGAHG